MTPTLAGQHADYISKQLADFHHRSRRSYSKDVFAEWLVDQFNHEIAAYYESLPTPPNKPAGSTESLLFEGERIYKSHCSACHGLDGIETRDTLTPRLMGLYSTYVSNQLNAYKTGDRTNDTNGVMRDIVAQLSRQQIFEVSEYIQSMAAR